MFAGCGGRVAFKYRMTEEGLLNHRDRSGGDLKEVNLPGISVGGDVLAQVSHQHEAPRSHI